MNILIMRHGQAEAHAATDFERPLTTVGLQQASAAGACLSSQAFCFEQVWVSPYLRAQQTADQLLDQFPVAQRRRVDLLVPESRPSELLDAINDEPCEGLLLVSHQPLVSSLVSSLTGDHVAMAPASMALLEAPIAAPACAQLQWLRHAPGFERE